MRVFKLKYRDGRSSESRYYSFLLAGQENPEENIMLPKNQRLHRLTQPARAAALGRREGT